MFDYVRQEFVWNVIPLLSSGIHAECYTSYDGWRGAAISGPDLKRANSHQLRTVPKLRNLFSDILLTKKVFGTSPSIFLRLPGNLFRNIVCHEECLPIYVEITNVQTDSLSNQSLLTCLKLPSCEVTLSLTCLLTVKMTNMAIQSNQYHLSRK